MFTAHLVHMSFTCAVLVFYHMHFIAVNSTCDYVDKYDIALRKSVGQHHGTA